VGRTGDFLVVGLGRFGSALAGELETLGRDVLGVDLDPRFVQAHAEALTHVVQADATDVEAMRELGAADFTTAAVAIGSNIEASVLATSVLVDLKVPNIVAKAITTAHGRILERVGAHRVVFPEADQGRAEARRMAGRNIIDMMEVEGGFLLVETLAPMNLVGKRLDEAALRSGFGVTVVAIRHQGQQPTHASPDTVIESGDILVVAGKTEPVERFVELR
jgi:trk system potassium uptake protein